MDANTPCGILEAQVLSRIWKSGSISDHIYKINAKPEMVAVEAESEFDNIQY